MLKNLLLLETQQVYPDAQSHESVEDSYASIGLHIYRSEGFGGRHGLSASSSAEPAHRSAVAAEELHSETGA